MDISVVVAVFNEQGSLPELTKWISDVMVSHNFSFEIIFIDDGSTDKSWEIIEKQARDTDSIKGIKFRRNYGKSAALHTGFAEAQGEVIITMDADMQDNPEEIPELYTMIKDRDYDLVSGWKKNRKDPVLSKNIPSKLFNAAARKISGVKIHDFNCGLKAYKNEVVKSIEVYGEMHRYIPFIAKEAGFVNISEKTVTHQKRKYGKTKFGPRRFIHGFLDLLSIFFISKFSKKPMHFFGVLGSVSFILGFLVLLYLSVLKVFYNVYQMDDRPLFYFGFLAIIFGTQLFLTGFLGELMSRSVDSRNVYQIERRI